MIWPCLEAESTCHCIVLTNFIYATSNWQLSMSRGSHSSLSTNPKNCIGHLLVQSLDVPSQIYINLTGSRSKYVKVISGWRRKQNR